MPESFQVHRFAEELRSRWKLMAISCAAAAVLATIVTLVLPKQYTAVARLVIEPPAGGEARASMVVSPQYLESLKTYEHFVSADSLFRKALDQFGLRVLTPGRSMEAWKRRVLEAPRVEIVWFDEAGHMPPIEMPEEFQQALIEKLTPLARR